MAKVKFKIRVDEKKRVKLLIKYIKRLNNTRFFAEVRRKFQADSEQRTLERQARLIIQEAIYDAYTPRRYVRTYSAIRSIRVAGNQQGRVGGLLIYSDVSVAAAKLLPAMSYITFFEKPVAFKSFIKPRGQRDIANYRPFTGRLTALMSRHSKKLAKRSYAETIQELMPGQLKHGI